MEAPADRLAALEARVEQLETVVVAIGGLVTDEFEPHGPARIIEKAAALEERYAAAGHADAARLMQAFRSAIRKPWSFLEWLDTKFG